MTSPAPPEVRQCQDYSDPNYGAVAVASGVDQYTWAVMHPIVGGHWDHNNETVASWTVLQ